MRTHPWEGYPLCAAYLRLNKHNYGLNDHSCYCYMIKITCIHYSRAPKQNRSSFSLSSVFHLSLTHNVDACSSVWQIIDWGEWGEWGTAGETEWKTARAFLGSSPHVSGKMKGCCSPTLRVAFQLFLRSVLLSFVICNSPDNQTKISLTSLWLGAHST